MKCHFSLLIISLLLSLYSCNSSMEQNRHQENQTKNETKNQSDKNNRGKYKIQFEQENAEQLANLPLKCLQTQYPNKTSQTLEVTGDLGTPKELHPAFYGCFDWHSS